MKYICFTSISYLSTIEQYNLSMIKCIKHSMRVRTYSLGLVVELK